MGKFLEFINKIHIERDLFFEEMIRQYEKDHKSYNYWNGSASTFISLVRF